MRSFAAFLLLVLGIPGCGAGGDESRPAPDPWHWCMVDADALPEQADPRTPSLRHGELRLQVPDPGEALERIPAILQTVGAFEAGRAIEAPNDAQGVPGSTRLTLRVETRKMGLLVESLATLGQVVADHRRTAEPTEAIVGLQARLATERRTEADLASRLEQAGPSTQAGATLAAELGKVRERIASLAARAYVIENSLAQASLVVHLEPPVAKPEPGFWQDALATFLGSARTPGGVVLHLLALGVAALPWIGAAVLGTWLTLRAAARRRRPGGPAA